MMFAVALAAAAPTLAQADLRDPFSGMSAAGRAKAVALNEKISMASAVRVETMVAARNELKAAINAEPLDMARVRVAAERYERALLDGGDSTLLWVELAATLEPADRAFILARLPRIGGVMRPPPPPPMPPLPPKAPGNPVLFKVTPRTLPAPGSQ